MWGVFQLSDLTHNNLEISTSIGNLSDFVSRFHQELDCKPGLERNHMVLRTMIIPRFKDYFVNLTSRSKSPELNRPANVCEVMHLGLLANLSWEELWKGSG